MDRLHEQVLALVGGDRRLVEAMRTSVGATLAWAERNIAEARVWNGQGQQVERTGKLAIRMTARAPRAIFLP